MGAEAAPPEVEDNTSFVERCFDVNGNVLMARFYLPVLNPSGEFRCHWSLKSSNLEIRRYACGEDGLQALMLALRAVSTELSENEGFKSQRITLWGQTDLDLPPGWGAGPLYAQSSCKEQ
jgi:hypothetical protein